MKKFKKFETRENVDVTISDQTTLLPAKSKFRDVESGLIVNLTKRRLALGITGISAEDRYMADLTLDPKRKKEK